MDSIQTRIAMLLLATECVKQRLLALNEKTERPDLYSVQQRQSFYIESCALAARIAVMDSRANQLAGAFAVWAEGDDDV